MQSMMNWSAKLKPRRYGPGEQCGGRSGVECDGYTVLGEAAG